MCGRAAATARSLRSDTPAPGWLAAAREDHVPGWLAAAREYHVPASGLMLPAIVGVGGLSLQSGEAELLRAFPPAGVILFGRNVADPEQLAALVRALRRVLPGEAVLMVDQEGGRVARLQPPHWLAHPPARRIGALFASDAAAGLRAAWLTGALIGAQCGQAGFDLVAAPVLDVASPEGHDVIGDRAYSADPEAVAALGGAMVDGLLAAGVQPVGKHAPGHGRAPADSHLSLPSVDGVSAADLAPFRLLSQRPLLGGGPALPWLMTAHVRYMSEDMTNPATLSATIIRDIIRSSSAFGPSIEGERLAGIGFGGVLVSDDLAMQALSGSAGARAKAAVAAGCDLALHCSGVLAETADVLASLAPAGGAALARLETARLAAEPGASRGEWDAGAMDRERAALFASAGFAA